MPLIKLLKKAMSTSLGTLTFPRNWSTALSRAGCAPKFSKVLLSIKGLCVLLGTDNSQIPPSCPPHPGNSLRFFESHRPRRLFVKHLRYTQHTDSKNINLLEISQQFNLTANLLLSIKSRETHSIQSPEHSKLNQILLNPTGRNSRRVFIQEGKKGEG